MPTLHESDVMGEKVYVTSGPPIDPPKQSTREPLNYAASDIPSQFRQRFFGAVKWLGGWPQVAFAFALAVVLALLCDALKPHSDTPPLMFVAAFILGIVLRVPLRKDF